MKEIYIRVRTNTLFGYDIIHTKVYKEYKEYGVCIVKYDERYIIVDTKTGLRASRIRYTHLRIAKLFMEHPEQPNFKDWYEMVEKARNTHEYQKKILRVR